MFRKCGVVVSDVVPSAALHTYIAVSGMSFMHMCTLSGSFTATMPHIRRLPNNTLPTYNTQVIMMLMMRRFMMMTTAKMMMMMVVMMMMLMMMMRMIMWPCSFVTEHHLQQQQHVGPSKAQRRHQALVEEH